MRERERVLRREKEEGEEGDRDIDIMKGLSFLFFILTLSFRDALSPLICGINVRSSPAYEEKKRPQKEEERRGADKERSIEEEGNVDSPNNKNQVSPPRSPPG